MLSAPLFLGHHQAFVTARLDSPINSERIGRYTLLHELAAGGMATVHLARFHGEAGFSRLMVVKRLHAQFAKDPDFVCMFLDEARLASRIRHPHVVSVLDVAALRGELLLAMEYVHGLPLSKLLRLAGPQRIPLPIVAAIVNGMLLGLHAAHEATSDKGTPLQIVHRDVSPQNVMIGADGMARVVDFGIASAVARLQTTAEGQVKGKLAYMAPEQLNEEQMNRRVDIFSSGLVLWEMLTGRRLIDGEPQARIRQVMECHFSAPSLYREGVSPELDSVVARALQKDPDQRYRTSEEMARALVAACRPALHHEVSEWLETLAQPILKPLAALVADAEAHSVHPAALPVPVEVEIPASRELRSLLQFELMSETGVRASYQTDGKGEALKNEGPAPPLRSARRFPARLFLLLSVGALLLALAIFAWRSSVIATTDVRLETKPITPTVAAAVNAAPQPSPALSLEPEPLAPPPVEAESKERPVVSPPRASRPTSPRASCSPPYVLLEGGLKKYKPECL